MNRKSSIVFVIASVAFLAGCSAGSDPLQGKWQGTVEVSGKLSLDALAALPGEEPGEISAPPRTEVAVLTCEFLGNNKLRLQAEPMPSKSPFEPEQLIVDYTVIEALPGQFRLQLDLKEHPRMLHLRFNDSENMTMTEEGGSPQLLPIAMTRMDAA